MSNIRIEYDYLLESGDLFDVVYGMIGNWSSDEARFTKHYEHNIATLNNLTVDFDEVYGYGEDDEDL